MLIQMKHSCQGCKDRTPGCHATCERHKADLEELERRKEKIRKDKLVDSYIESFHDKARVKDAKVRLKKDRYYAKGKSRN